VAGISVKVGVHYPGRSHIQLLAGFLETVTIGCEKSAEGILGPLRGLKG